MLTLSRARATRAPAHDATDQAERTHTVLPMVDAMPAEWPSHARRCLKQLPGPLNWAAPLLDPENPRALECTPQRARELLLWMHQRPSFERLIVGCRHRRRPA